MCIEARHGLAIGQIAGEAAACILRRAHDLQFSALHSDLQVYV